MLEKHKTGGEKGAVRNLSICERRSEHQSSPVLPEELHLRKPARVCCVGWNKALKRTGRGGGEFRRGKDVAGRIKAGTAWRHQITGYQMPMRIKQTVKMEALCLVHYT